MKKVLLLLAIVAALASGAKRDGPLTLSCDPCTVGESITINGTGYQSGGQNSLVVVVWGSPTPVSCATPRKDGTFTCVTSVPYTGAFQVAAYENPKTEIGSTWVTID